jgi:hypothetical protein
MHKQNYYIGWDDGSGTLKPGTLQKLRDGTELQDFKDGREFNIFDRRLRRQIQSITLELQKLGFVDNELHRREPFDTQWRRRRSIWKKLTEVVEDDGNLCESPEIRADYDIPEKDTLNSTYGTFISCITYVTY